MSRRFARNRWASLFSVKLKGLALYGALVLLPQVVWVFSNSDGSAAVHVCEDCSYLAGHTTVKSAEAAIKTNNPSYSAEPELVEDTGVGLLIREIAGHHGESQSHPRRLYSNASSLCTCKVGGNRDLADLEESESDGGWHTPHSLPILTGPCTIQRRNSSLSEQDFLEMFAYNEPVILTGMSNQSLFRAHSTKKRLLLDYGQEIITVATANTHSYHKVKMVLCEYIEREMKPQTMDNFGNETLYHFGDNDREGWEALFSLYQLPPFQLPGMEPVLSFGLAGPGTGVPFHVHGPTFAETIYGRKRWFLYPPAHTPTFHPDVSTLHWVTHTYPTLTGEGRPLECTLHPEEILYFPDGWWHATLNVDSAVFVSTFYSQLQ